MGELKARATQTFTEIDKKTYKQRNYDAVSENIFTLTYKGKIEDLSKVQKIQYFYKSISNEGSGIVENPSEKEILHLSSCRGGRIVSKNEVVKVTVEVDGKTETFELISIDN